VLKKLACYLCASNGTPMDDLIYCNVCCEPYHIYCIEDYERPKLNTNRLDWICPACKFCDLCGKQNDLLHCNMCENAYHANCFRKLNYPKKATRKQQLWVSEIEC
jgi:[histone H3]-lysine4 N-trimethyltransferase MLL4